VALSTGFIWVRIGSRREEDEEEEEEENMKKYLDDFTVSEI
jgi:hypothetical protein